MMFSVFCVFPAPLLLVLFVQSFCPRLVTAFHEQSVADEVVYLSTLRLSALASALVLVGGLLARG